MTNRNRSNGRPHPWQSGPLAASTSYDLSGRLSGPSEAPYRSSHQDLALLDHAVYWYYQRMWGKTWRWRRSNDSGLNFFSGFQWLRWPRRPQASTAVVGNKHLNWPCSLVASIF